MSGRRRATRAAAGFTLIEVLAVVLVTAVLLGATINFYVDLSRQAARASENMREVRRASALLDRIAADLEHTMLVTKPAEADAISSPWLFLAQSRYSLTGAQAGSDQVKFIRREIPRASDGPASDLAMVAYTLERSEENESFVLRRWSTPELPESLDLEFPRSDDPASFVLADDLRHFAMRFLDMSGQWHDRWDSTQVAESGDLPLAVELEVALVAPESDIDRVDETEPLAYRRMVELPLRPIDLEKLLEPEDEETDTAETAADDEDTDTAAGGKRTLGKCIDPGKLGPPLSESDIAQIIAIIKNSPDADITPYLELLRGHPALDPDCS
jgi:type II secretion system protein J